MCLMGVDWDDDGDDVIVIVIMMMVATMMMMVSQIVQYLGVTYPNLEFAIIVN